MAFTSRTSVLVVITMALLAFGACNPPPKEDLVSKAKQDQAQAQGGGSVDAPKASRLDDQDQRQIIARVNDELIPLGEFERRLNAQAPFARSRYNSIERKRDFLNNLIQFEVLADEAMRRGLDKDPEVVLELKQAMVRKMMAADLDKRMSQVTITDEELKAYYDSHLKDYIRPAKVRASQIVLPDEATALKVTKELQDAFAKDPTHKRKIFALKARDVSIDKPTAELGGDMRFFAKPEDGGVVPKEISDVAFGLKDVGKISPPTKTAAGWHILMLTAKKQRYERTFDEVKRNIQNRLYRERRAMIERELVDELKKKAKIEIKDDLLATIKDPEPPKDQPKGTEHDHGAPKVIPARPKMVAP